MITHYAVVVGSNEEVVGVGATEARAWEDARAQLAEASAGLDHARLVDFDADAFTPSFVDGVVVIARRRRSVLRR